jgi:hypothetical protein
MKTNIMAMPTSTQSPLEIVLSFVKDSWPMIIGIVTAWKGIDAIAKYYSDRQDARLKVLIRTEIAPDIDKLQGSIDTLANVIDRLSQHGK